MNHPPLISIDLSRNVGVAVYPPGSTFGPRRMRDFEFVWIIEGDCKYRVGDQTHDCPPGSIVLCRPGTVDSFEWDKRRPTRHAYFHFMFRRIPRAWPARAGWPVLRPTGSSDVLQTLFQYVLHAGREADKEAIAYSILTMLRSFITGQSAIAEPPRDLPPDPVERALAYIHRTLELNPAIAIALDEIASEACVTPAYLCRVFQRAVGRSPMQCVRLARLDRAVTLLSRTNLSVGQIAELCGFASQFHFARRFRDAFGATPTEIRRQIRDGRVPPLPRLIRYPGREGQNQA